MLGDTRISKLDLIIDNPQLLLKKINCRVCQRLFSESEIKEKNYNFVVNYDNSDCFGEKKNNHLEKIGKDYYLSLKVCWVEHKNCKTVI